ncbi:hypothetical protein ACJW30_10G019200 [Castanea mollissima]
MITYRGLPRHSGPFLKLLISGLVTIALSLLSIRITTRIYTPLCLESGEFALELEKPARYVPWCSVNPCLSPENMEAEMSKFPLYFNGPKPFQCTVKPGQILYLPSMWFHHVRQSPDAGGRTIAINYWYDMQFDIKYAYFNFLKSIQYRSIHDPTLPETASKDTDTESDCDSIAYGFKDEFSANGSVENLVGGSTKEE